MQPVLTWLIDMNVVVSQSTAAEQLSHSLLRIKNFLSGGLPTGSNGLALNRSGSWRVIASSNAVTSALSDLWITGSDVVSGNLTGSGRSWIIMQSPTPNVSGSDGFPYTGSYMQLMIAADVPVNTMTDARFVMTTSANPFSTSSISHITTPANPAQAMDRASPHRTLFTTPVANHTMHMWRSTMGDFLVGVSQDASTRTAYGVVALAAYNGDRPDPWPGMFGPHRNTAGDGVFSRESVWNAASSLHGWSTTNAIDTTACGAVYPKFNSNTEFTYTGGTSTITGRAPAFPMDVYRRATPTHYRGRLTAGDIAYTPGTVARNTIESGSDPIQRIAIGDIWMLTTGSALFIGMG